MHTVAQILGLFGLMVTIHDYCNHSGWREKLDDLLGL